MLVFLKKVYRRLKRTIPNHVKTYLRYTVWGTIGRTPKQLYGEFKGWYRGNTFRNAIGMHTVFIAKENILFLKEWILYHKLKGVDYFFLYDNSGVEILDDWDLKLANLGGVYRHQPSSTSKHGVRYDTLVKLSSTEIATIMDDIRRTIPGVYFVKWQPRNEDGKIGYEQLKAFHDAENRFGHLCDWIFNIDTDEFLVSASHLKDITRHLFVRDYAGGSFQQKKMGGRFQNLDKYCVEIERECEQSAYNKISYNNPKYLYRTGQGAELYVHEFKTSGAKYFFRWDELIFNHYNDDPWNKTRTRKIAMPVIDPKLIAELKKRCGDHCSPEWRTKSVTSATDIWVKDAHLPDKPSQPRELTSSDLI